MSQPQVQVPVLAWNPISPSPPKYLSPVRSILTLQSVFLKGDDAFFDVFVVAAAATPTRDLIISKQGVGRLYYRIALEAAPRSLNIAAGKHMKECCCCTFQLMKWE